MDEAKIQSRRWITLLVMGVAVIVTGLQNTMTNVGLPSLQAQFGADASTAQWFLNSYILTFAGLLLLMGALGDKFGRKLLLNLGLLLFGVGSLMAAAVTSIDASSSFATSNGFITTQIIMGVGAAMLTPQTLSIIFSVFKKSERAMAVAIWTALAALGAGMGPLVGGLLLEHYDVSSLFYVNIPLILFALVVGWFVVPESKKENAPKVDLIGTVLSIVTIVAFVAGFIFVPDHGWTGLYTLMAFLVAAVAGVLFVSYESKIKNPILDMKLFKDRFFVNGVIGIGILFFNLMGLMFLATQFMQIVQQKSALDAGLLMMPMVVTLAIASIAGQKLAEKFGYTKVIIYGVTASAVGMLLVSLWQVTSPDWAVAVTLSIVGLGVGVALAPSTNNIMKSFNAKNAGMGSSVNMLARQVFGAIGIAVLGSVLNSKYAENLEPYVAGAPAEIADQITGSIQGAYELALDFVAQGQQAIASSVISTVNAAFMVGLSAAMTIAVIVTLLVAVNISRHTPKD